MEKLDLEKLKKSKTTEELIKFGVINIDKPSRPTSFMISQYVKSALKLNKTSHLGTLDPQVSGVLPIALGRACRLNDYLMHRNKTYVGIMRLHKEVSEPILKKVISEFIGVISQLPPVKSNVKRAFRQREIHSFDIIEINGTDILFKTEVEAGTYIRKLCSDMGEKLGGAHMLELRRVAAGSFSEEKSINLYDFDKIMEEYKKGNDKPLREIIIPGELVANLNPVVHIDKQVVKKVLTGSPIFPKFLSDKKEIINLNKDDKICIFSDKTFIGCYNFIGDKNITAVPEFVFN